LRSVLCAPEGTLCPLCPDPDWDGHKVHKGCTTSTKLFRRFI